MADALSPIARGQQAMADSLAVVLPSDQSSIPVTTELPAAASISAENTTAPTAPSVYGFGLVFDGTNWDRMPGTSADGVQVNLGTNNDVTITGSVDTELPAAAALADDVANPTVPAVGAFGMGWDSGNTNWNRVEVDDAGHLQIDVLTGGGSDTPTNPVIDTQTSAAVGSGASVDLTTAAADDKKLALVQVWGSNPFRVRVYTVDNAVESTNAVAVGGAAAWQTYEFRPSHRNYVVLGNTAGLDAFRVEFTNLGAAASDAFATFYFED